MKRDEPVNPEIREQRETRMRTQPSSLAAELSGYCDLGMRRQALRLMRTILKKRRILPEEFSEVTLCICMITDFKRWRLPIEAAYNRQTLKFKRKMRSDMLALYAATGDWKAARPFVSIHRTLKVADFCFGMDVLLELGELKAAERLANRCRRLLLFAPDRFHQSILLRALGDFLSRTHRWDEALTVWEAMPLEQPFRCNALSGIVEIHLARALEATQRGLELLSELKKNPDNEIELCLPGNDLGMTQDAEKELLKLRRGIDKLLPVEKRKELAINVNTYAN